ncbi:MULTISPECIES: RNA chaperone Hfq [Clostridium]|uniref:RNA-binding protein Hfq n=1 Tax=Clostridium cibarium TaxID=2762247 RepID=A0ABR8PTP0_9CLOT|nr:MULTISPECIES: RNA chaperone Hfq [Clostridium]MBD7911541.1 RNA chaperone Hfq [Clostridium cibarium]
MTKQQNNLQDIFLNSARKNKNQVVIYLTNGFQLKGFVTGFDAFTVVLDQDGKQVLIYKHAITTVTPSKPILFTETNTDNNI